MSAITYLAQRLAGDHAVLLAYSGGLDSTVLLHQLVQLRQRCPTLQLRTIHIHHGLSSHADSWVAHCQQQCERWQVPLVVEKVCLDPRDGGIEAAARRARYQMFDRHIQPGEVLLTAQHLDDQCETLLLALKRGSGPAGLAAMPEDHQPGAYRHLRPLLHYSRAQLAQWATQHQLSWVDDESNQDPRYDRNFLRLQVIPLLRQRWPHFSAAAGRSAALCGEQEQLLDELLAESLAALTAADGSLHFTPLLTMSEARRAALLRRWIASQQGSMPSRDALQRLWQEVICSREDAAPRLRLGQAEIRRFRDRLWWLPLMTSLRDQHLPWSAPWQPLTLPDNLGQLVQATLGITLAKPQPGQQVSVRFQAQGRYHIQGRAGSRPLKKIWQELAIPPWQRERTPLIFYDDLLIAAVGVFITREGMPHAAEAGWTICWQKENNRQWGEQ